MSYSGDDDVPDLVSSDDEDDQYVSLDSTLGLVESPSENEDMDDTCLMPQRCCNSKLLIIILQLVIATCTLNEKPAL